MKKTLEVVDCTNDAQMIALGIRPPHLIGRDQSVWTKTDKEKEKLKRLKSSSKSEVVGGGKQVRTIPVNGKLVVYINPDKEHTIFDVKTKKHICKTTYSYTCNQDEIFDYLRRLGFKNVTKYSWNGRTYRRDELPFWFKSKRYRNQ